MLIWPDCLACILRMSLAVARPAIKDENQLRSFVTEVLQLEPFRGEAWSLTPPEVIRDVWLKLNELLEGVDPLEEMKAQQNHRALEVQDQCRQLISQSRDPFREALKLAIIGNSIDLLADTHGQAISDVPRRLSSVTLNQDAVHAFEERVLRARNVVYLADNCGEIVFDKLLIETILQSSVPQLIIRSIVFNVFLNCQNIFI